MDQKNAEPKAPVCVALVPKLDIISSVIRLGNTCITYLSNSRNELSMIIIHA